MPACFLSYAREDESFAKYLHEALISSGRECVWDQDQTTIRFSAPWRAEIKAAIERSDKFIFIISPDSLTSEACGTELDHAIGMNKQIIPILLRGPDQEQKVPETIEEIQWVRFSDGIAFDVSFGQLTEALDIDLEYAKAHTRLLVRSLEWAQASRESSRLLRGRELLEAEEWLKDAGNHQSPAPTQTQREHITVSRRAADRSVRRRRHALISAVAVVGAAAVTVSVIVMTARGQAGQQASLKQANVFAALSDQALSTNQQSADLLALAGWQEGHDADTRSSLLSRQADPYLGSIPIPADYQVTSLAISPDGRLLAIGGMPVPGGQLALSDLKHSSVWLWDLAARRKLAIFADLGGFIQSTAFSPDGETLAAVPVGGPSSLLLWSVATRKALPDPPGARGPFTALAYSPDGRAMAIARCRLVNVHGCPDPVIDLWDLARNRLMGQLTGSQGTIRTLAFSPDGTMLADGGDDDTVRVWNVATRATRAVLRDYLGSVHSVEFSPDGTVLASASEDGTAHVWTVKGGTQRTVFTLSNNDTPSIAFSHAGYYLYVLDPARDQLNIVDAAYNTNVVVPVAPDGELEYMASSPSGSALVLGGGNGYLTILDEGSHSFSEAGNSSLFSVAVSPAGNLAATSAEDGTVQLWAPSDPSAPARHLSTGLSSVLVSSVSFSQDGRYLATGGAGSSVILWDVKTATKAAVLSPPGGPAADGVTVNQVAFSPDQETLAVYRSDCTAQVWDAATRRQIAVIPAGSGTNCPLGGLAYSPDGKTLALFSDSSNVLLWSIPERRTITSIAAGQGGVSAIAFSPGGHLLATGGSDFTVKLWTVPGYQFAGTIGSLTTAVRSLAFSPDGTMLATVTQDAAVQLWSVATRQPVATLSGQAQQVNAVAFTHDGQSLITAAADGTARLWDLNPQDEVRRLCAALRGPKFTAQWQELKPSPGPDPCISK